MFGAYVFYGSIIFILVLVNNSVALGYFFEPKVPLDGRFVCIYEAYKMTPAQEKEDPLPKKKPKLKPGADNLMKMSFCHSNVIGNVDIDDKEGCNFLTGTLPRGYSQQRLASLSKKSDTLRFHEDTVRRKTSKTLFPEEAVHSSCKVASDVCFDELYRVGLWDHGHRCRMKSLGYKLKSKSWVKLTAQDYNRISINYWHCEDRCQDPDQQERLAKLCAEEEKSGNLKDPSKTCASMGYVWPKPAERPLVQDQEVK